MSFLVLDDKSARLEIAMFPDCFEQYGSKVEKDELLVFEGEVQTDDRAVGGISLRAERVLTLAEARRKFSDGIVIDLTELDVPTDFNPRLKDTLDPYRQGGEGCPVVVLYQGHDARARISLGSQWRVSPEGSNR